MKFRNALVAATILALPLAAKAQPIDGLYIGAGGGVNIMQNEDAKVTSPPPGSPGSGQLKTRVGPAFDLSAGYGLGNGFRAEIEGSYRYNTFYSPRGAAVGGQEQKYGAMVNVLYDFVDLVPYVQPYVGIGGGYQWTQDRHLYVGDASVKTDTIGKPAYQGIVGAAIPIPGAPGLAVTADYRFLGIAGDRNYGASETVAGHAVPANFKLNNDFNHTILIGVRYAFGAPAPAPEAPPVAAVPVSPVSRSYLVFFDWDKSNLTDRARQIVSEAASNSTKVQYTRIEVNGYTDTSGTPQYNQGLSIRRAQTVAAELVKDGVPKTAIAIQGFGETHLLVPTGAGVREPQNRRVEIIIK
jgi:outer membrane protein OmpA-like peptidoglycan-associated protein